MMDELFAQRFKRARGLVATSWSGPGVFSWQCRGTSKGVRFNPMYGKDPNEPMWLEVDGAACSWNDEGVTYFSVQGALQAAFSRNDITAAWDELEKVHGGEISDLRSWLDEPTRHRDEVLELFDRAILRLRRGEDS